MQSIVVSVSNDLLTDQRVAKVCATLADSDYEVHLIGKRSAHALRTNCSYEMTRLRIPFSKGFLFYACFNIQLFFSLLFKRKDILLANDLDTLLANYLVSKLQGKPLVFDSHELFSEIPELVHRPLTKSFWRSLEAWILPRVRYGYTVSDSIARYYQKEYGVDFAVIRNVPETVEDRLTKPSLKLPENKKIILYQGAINVGRGLELMIETMKFIDEAVFLMIGEGDILKKLQSLVKEYQLDDKVFFLGRTRPEILKNISPEAALGISLEEDLGLNYRYALPNKLFDYIHAKIPVLVADLPEMSKLVYDYDVGEVLKDRSVKMLTQTVQSMLHKGKGHWQPQLEIASNEFVWEKESKKLINLFNQLG